MSAFDADYQPLYEMYDDEYFPNFLVDKIKAEIDKVETVLTRWRNQYRRHPKPSGHNDAGD
jgi:hypothetical protein